MAIRELLELFIDENFQKISVWDNEQEKVIWSGYLYDLPDDLGYEEISSIDNLDKKTDVLTINIR